MNPPPIEPTASSPGLLETLQPLRCAIDAALDRYTAAVEGCPQRLTEAIRYSVLAPGKRLRPILALLACQATSGSWQAALPVACAVEMIHAYSLVHDDLPAMDNDDLRRGRPTCHRAFDEATAILVGDSLQMLAVETICRDMPTDLVPRCCQILAVAAGRSQLVGGQMDDLAAEGRFADSTPASQQIRTVEQLQAIHARKTGALIVASLELGGVAGRAELDHLRGLREFGRAVGLAFQIIDDCLDIEATAEQMGKRTRKDSTAGKLTYPGLIGLEASRQMAERLVDQALDAIAALGSPAAPLRQLARFIITRTS
ncbi:MAG: polyprenyl synthetase family protein [Planctomycetota bacterium]|nr:MAG: polyprenyl synthetase family protein [Planctomycetota bacterium]